MTKHCALAIALCCAVVARADNEAPAATGDAAIRRTLGAQQEAWNRRDLDRFMAGYWRSPELTFYSGGQATRGWQATLDRYRARYQGEGREMGTLGFSELTVEMLGADAAVARGRWHLALSGGKEAGGLFTLVWRRFPDGWRIVHDHTSTN